LVVEYPAGKTAGGFLDFWQRPVADACLTGPDQGKGATYIVVGRESDPEEYQKEVFVIQSATNNLFFGLRILDTDPAYYAKFKATLKMGRHGKPLESCRFIENADIEWSATATTIRVLPASNKAAWVNVSRPNASLNHTAP
jgi:hypothetical protein